MSEVLGDVMLVMLTAAATWGVLLLARRRRGHEAVDELSGLDRVEIAAATAPLAKAARLIAEHAVALVGSDTATVIFEDEDGTVRAEAGHPSGGFGSHPGASSMRLLEVAGAPAGSLSVDTRPGRPFASRDDRLLDALAARVEAGLRRRLLDAEVRTERAKSADILAASSDGIFSVGPEGRVTSWNPAMERITGVAATAAVGASCCKVFRPVEPDGDPLFGTRCPGRSAEPIGPLDMRVGDGDAARWLTTSFSPLDGGGYVAVARDVTEQRHVEEMKRDFLATVSHELRTPLTPIRGFLHTLRTRGDEIDPADRARIHEVLLRQTARLERLVDDLLLATHLQTSAAMFHVEVVDWATIARGTVELFREQHADRALTVDGDDGVLAVADQQRAEQVLVNLLDNALRYSPGGSPIAVSVRARGATVRTTVADRGPGIAPDDRARVFERFVRLGDHLTRPDGGTGLGLWIARELVEGMGGEIGVTAHKGGGSVFWFTLPAQRARKRAASSPAHAARA